MDEGVIPQDVGGIIREGGHLIELLPGLFQLLICVVVLILFLRKMNMIGGGQGRAPVDDRSHVFTGFRADDRRRLRKIYEQICGDSVGDE